MNNKFTLELSSNLDYDGMVIYICYNMHPIIAINYDKGIDNLEIELMQFGEHYSIVLPLDELLAAIEEAKKLAKKCAQEDEEIPELKHLRSQGKTDSEKET